MTHFNLLIGLYYFAAFIGIFLHRYFSRFIASDFQYGRTIRIKRYLTIGYYYLIGFYSFYLLHFMRDNKKNLSVFYAERVNVIVPVIVVSILAIILLYGYMAFSLEAPKKFHKKRKWK